MPDAQTALAELVTSPASRNPEERPTVARAFLDTLGCIAAGRAAGSTRAAVKAVSALDGRPLARSAADRQAMALGVAAHALDFDDVLEAANAHASAVLVPTALTCARQVGATLADAYDAFTRGYLVLYALGRLMNPAHYAAGWHATSTLGVVGAAATAGTLLGLDRAGMSHALGLSTSLAAGLKRQFGFGAKHFHAGNAAAAGIQAAYLAAHGMTAADDLLTGAGGLRERYDGPDGSVRNLADPVSGLPSRNLWLKRYPSCAATHRPLAALTEAVGAVPGRPAGAAVSEVTVSLAEISRRSLGRAYPTTAMQARFSVEYCLAVLLTRGDLTLADFSPASLADPDLRALAGRMRVMADPEQDGGLAVAVAEESATVVVTTTDGATSRVTCTVPPGHPRAPLSTATVVDKYEGCLAYTGLEPGDLPARLLDPDHWRTPAADALDEAVGWLESAE